MNIFIRELTTYRKSLIWWSVGILLMIIGGMGKYSYYVKSDQSITDIVSQIPETLRAVLGFGNFDITKASGFYGMLFFYLMVMLAIHATMIGSNIISKEEKDKTTEFLMVKPVSRARIITEKLVAALTNIVILNVITLVLSIVIVGKYSNGEDITGDIVVLMVGMFITQVLFFVMGTAIAAVSTRPRLSASVATGVLLITFMISVIMDINSKLTDLKYITPFKYFDAEDVMNGGLNIVFIILSVIIITVLCYVTYLAYCKRDLKV